MQGSLYPNGVLIDRTALRRTETSKATQILKMRTDITSRGVYSGGAVTVNVGNTDHIDIAAFSGYTPRGDYIEEIGSISNLALADYISPTVNVVCAVYTESNIHSQPHETDGSTYPTEAQGTYRTRVFTQANFDNPAVLPATDDNLQNDALDRCLILCKVTAQGVGAALTAATDIQQPTEFNSILYTSPQDLVTLTGVTILSVQSDTPTGTGTITFDDTGAPPYSFKYTSPGGVISAAVTTSTDDILTITDGSGYWIKIQVLVSQLPTGLVVPYAETFSIINLYYQEIPRLTAEDIMHRNFLGTGIITPHNPHGQTLDDFAGTTLSLLDEHQDVMHCNGIWKGSASGIFQGSVNTGTALGDTLNITSPLITDLFYVNGTKQNAIDSNQVIFSPVNVTGALGAGSHLGAKLFEFYVDDNETLVSNLRLEVTHPRNCSGIWIVDMSPDHPSGSFSLRMVITAGPAATVSLQWGDTDSYAESVPTPTVSGVTGQVIRLYHPDNVNWVDVFIGDDAGATDLYLPVAGTYTDTVTVNAALDRDDHMQFMSVPYWYDSVAGKGIIGYPFTGGTRYIPDTRLWGTTCVTDMADAALEHMTYQPTFEYSRAGLLNRRHLGHQTDWQVANLSAPSRDIRQSGGVCYIRGKRLEAEGEDQTLLDNQTTIVWVDYEGDLHYDDFSAAPFTSSYQQAIEWLVGYPQDRDVEEYSTYLTDSEVTPQRGLPLYVITTLAGAVTNTVDLTRFVGAHVEDWSVGSAANHAQFATLESAFAYAAHENQVSVAANENIVIKLVGTSTITTTVTQPTNVIVEGSWDTGAALTVSPSAPDTDGSWRLSAGCIVRNVRITNSVAGPVFGLANNVVLDRIYCAAATGNFSTITQSAADVTIKGCYIRADLGMFYVPGALVASFPRMKIKDCYVYSTSSQGNPLIKVDDADYCEITGNYVIKDNQNTNIDPAIEVSNTADAWIEKNLVQIGAGDASAPEKGIHVTTCVGAQIKGNYVTRSGGASVYGIGIQANDSSSVIIEENIVNLMAEGIVGGSYDIATESGFFENITISNNLIAACYSSAINVQADTAGTVANQIVGARIEGNQIHFLAKSAVADALFGTALYGIKVYATNTSLISFRDIIIKNNTIDSVANSQAAGNTYGIILSVTSDLLNPGSTDMIEVEDNSVSRITCTSGNDVYGILGYAVAGSPGVLGLITNWSFSRNSVYLTSSYGAGTGSLVYGMYLETAQFGSNNPNTYRIKVDDNNIYVLAAPVTAVGDGIYVPNTGIYSFKNSSFNNNTIQVPWYGITASVQEQSAINDNQLYTGSVGIFSDRAYGSSISNNYIKVQSDNENTDLTIDSTNYGQMGILVVTNYSRSVIKNNKIEMYENTSANTLMRGSASYALSGAGEGFVIDNNTSFHYYDDLAAGGGGTEQAFHIYIADPDFAWSCSYNTIFNDGLYQVSNVPSDTPSKSHGIYIDFLGGGVTAAYFRGSLMSNRVFGSNSTIHSHYEFYVASYGAIAEGGVCVMNNYLSLHVIGTPVNALINTSFPGIALTNSANVAEQVSGSVWGSATF